MEAMAKPTGKKKKKKGKRTVRQLVIADAHGWLIRRRALIICADRRELYHAVMSANTVSGVWLKDLRQPGGTDAV